MGHDHRDDRGLRRYLSGADTGRIIASVVMLVGIGFVAILTAAAPDRFVATRREESAEVVAVRN